MSYKDDPPSYDEAAGPIRTSLHTGTSTAAPGNYQPPRHRPRTPPTLAQTLPDLYNPNPDLLFRYPTKYFCQKCKNYGYRSDKGNKPCKDCWKKFHRPITSSSSGGHYNPPAQKPAPAPRPPQHIYAPTYVPAPPVIQYVPQVHYQPVFYPPPPRPRVVRPGDPSIGGRLCWRCNGSGRVMGMFLFDDEICYTCNGVGRVF
ncbi:hypothetical protein BABINDRAFT_166132 [Babjeviella inositovora NRRL Y-12698]|uniref:Proline-rich protein HUA1 n=1 Tax=Babjeviella inositovora NRRL Y-12698 TaxID=984486 RepID=A0A1E3QSN1_9ASCO|nr:uncharacterized protein BABINDRAFT_166132 [Babjeviella inositovora NRRL Y-12698]ODQ80514.1 hypothetical protein BABINDRAFT_166132 [Babjeviella inositovora NRRL Y-12698]